VDTALAGSRRPVRAQAGLFYLAAAILIFNLIDGIMTLAVVSAGAADEANPLMSVSLGWGSVWFIVVKTSLVSAGVWLLWQRRQRRLAHAALIGLAALYAMVLGYHVQSVESIVRLVV
jgi:hypothetical protein